MRRYSVGIVCAGVMAQRMAKTLNLMNNKIQLLAISSSEKKKAERIAKKYHIPKVYSSYEEVALDAQIDIVYIASINTMHKELIEMFLEQGKNVLCEKPLVLNADNAQYLYNLARKKNVFLGEAMWILFLPCIQKLKDLLVKERIGQISFVEISLGYNMRKKERVFKRSLGGGVIYDLGIYELALCNYLFGQKITSMKSLSEMNGENVDIRSATLMKTIDGTIIIIKNDAMNKLDNSVMLLGGDGKIVIQNFPFSDCIYIYKGEEKEEIYCPMEIDQYAYEWLAVIEALNRKQITFDEYSSAMSVSVLREIELIMES